MLKNEQTINSSDSLKSDSCDVNPMATSSEQVGEGNAVIGPHGVPCIVDASQFLCSLLNVMEPHDHTGSRSNPIAYDEDVPLFALGLINTAIELGSAVFGRFPELGLLIQDVLFYNLMQFGMSMSPLVLSTVCNIVLNLYHHLRNKLKLQLEAFFSGVLLRIAGSAMEALVDFCRQDVFVTEMYVNFDCDISCINVFEDIANLLSKSAFPVNSPLSAMNALALDGLLAMIHSMAERVVHESSATLLEFKEYEPFWRARCENPNDSSCWLPFTRKMKQIKRKLMAGVDQFNRDSKKGLKSLYAAHLLPEIHNPKSIACFLRFSTGLDKIIIGDFLGSHDEFCIQVLHEFVRTFHFQYVNLYTALRIFLETFRLPGEAQKIQRVLEAFADRYYDQFLDILANRDAALLLSYSLIMLNTDQHNAQVKKKMSEEDLIRNNRRINGGNDLPRELLSGLYHSICENETRMIPGKASGVPLTVKSHWIGLVHKSKLSSPYIVCNVGPNLDYDIFSLLSGPSIATISVVYDHVEQDRVLQAYIDGFLSIAKISSAYDLTEVMDNLVVSICKFTNLLVPDNEFEMIEQIHTRNWKFIRNLPCQLI